MKSFLPSSLCKNAKSQIFPCLMLAGASVAAAACGPHVDYYDKRSLAHPPRPARESVTAPQRLAVRAAGDADELPDTLPAAQLGQGFDSRKGTLLAKCYIGNTENAEIRGGTRFRLEVKRKDGSATLRLAAIVVKEKNHYPDTVRYLGGRTAADCGDRHVSTVELGARMLFTADYRVEAGDDRLAKAIPSGKLDLETEPNGIRAFEKKLKDVLEALRGDERVATEVHLSDPRAAAAFAQEIEKLRSEKGPSLEPLNRFAQRVSEQKPDELTTLVPLYAHVTKPKVK